MLTEDQNYENPQIPEPESEVKNNPVPVINEEQIMDFENLHASTITSLSKLSGSINCACIFYLLPLTVVPVIQKRVTSKITVPHNPDKIGSIMAMSWTKMRRGIINKKVAKKSSKKSQDAEGQDLDFNENFLGSSRSLKNAVNIFITSPTKNLNVKLSVSKDKDGSKALMTGVKDLEDRTCCVKLILLALMRLQQTLDYMRENSGQTREVINWLKQVAQGPLVARYFTRSDGVIYGGVMEYSAYIAPDVQIPELDPLILGYCLSLIKDYRYYSVYTRLLDSLLKVTNIVDPNTQIQYYNDYMTNYLYKLGFTINRARFIEIMSNKDLDVNGVIGDSGFVLVHLGTNITDYTKLELPYVYNLPIPRDKELIPKHSFNIYNNGSVMQSGPGEAYRADNSLIVKQNRRRDAYYKFINLILNIRSYIEIKH